MAQEMLVDLRKHVQVLIANPSTATLDVKLFDKAELVLPDQLQQDDHVALIRELTEALQTVRQDPAPLTSLIQALLRPFSFSDVLAFDPPVDFTAGLNLGDHMVPINRLMLYVLSKASTPAEVAFLANKPDVVRALVHLWLSSSDTGVATQAGTLMGDLLQVDVLRLKDPDEMLPEPGTGQGLLWKRLLTDRDVYGTIYVNCDVKTNTIGGRQATLAQARLLDLLPKMAELDWDAVTASHLGDVETAHGVASGGLMSFAASHMVDVENDVLTYCLLMSFSSRILEATKDSLSPTPGVSLGLEFLLTHGLHERIVDVYLEADQSQAHFEFIFKGPSADYVSTYVSICQQHYLASAMPRRIKQYLSQKFDQSLNRWSHNDSPHHDLHVLASLPRVSLLPSENGSGDWKNTVLSLLPSRSSNADVLRTLATLFHGPRDEITFPAKAIAMSDTRLDEASMARALYLHYLAGNQTFWKDIVTHADTVALADTALAAISVLSAVITANWSVQPDLVLPSSVIATPETGHLAILSPPALEYVVPYLMKPPRLFSNLVGGRGDAESSAYKIAMAKYDALQLMHKRLAAQLARQPDPSFQDMLEAFGRRLADGPMSNAGETGGRIATLEL